MGRLTSEATFILRVWAMAFLAAFGFYLIYAIGLKGYGSLGDSIKFSAIFASFLVVILLVIAKVEADEAE